MNARQMSVSAARVSFIIVAITMTAFVFLADSTKADDFPPEVFAPGVDVWDVSASGAQYSFADTIIPAGFFGPSCFPFDGEVRLEGADSTGSGDIRIERPVELILNGSGTPTPVEIQIAELNLQSVEPIQVQCGDGDQEWDFVVGLSEEPPDPSLNGFMVVTRDRPTGGTFDASFFVRPLLTFTNVLSADVLVLDTADFGLDPAVFSIPDAPWTSLPPANVAPGDPNFVPGSTETGPSTVVISGLGLNLTVRPPLTLPVDSAIVSIGSGSDDAFDTPNGWPGFNANYAGIFSGAPGGNGPVFGGWRFENLNIPPGAVITGAHVEFTQLGWGSEFTTSLALEDSASPLPFTIDSTPSDRWENRSDAELMWEWPSQSPNSVIETPDLSPLLQEIVNRYNGADAITLLESGESVAQGDWHAWWSIEGDPSRAAQLHVEWVVDGALIPKSIELFIDQPSISLGETVQLSVIGNVGDTTIDLTSAARGTIYEQSSADIVTIDPDGLLTALNPGLVDITAINQGLFSSVQLEVVLGIPDSLAVAPENPLLLFGETQQLTVTGDFNGTTIDVTSRSLGTTYISTDLRSLTVDEDGNLEGVGVGEAAVIVENNGLEIEVPVTVFLGSPDLLFVSPLPSTPLQIGETRQLTVTAEFDDGSQVDVTSSSTGTSFISSDPGVGIVSQDGEVTALGVGQTEITVSNQGLETSVLIETALGIPDSLSIDPLSPDFLFGETQQLIVTGDFNGTPLDLTSPTTGTTYLSNDPGIVSVDQNGLLLAEGIGTTEIIVGNQGVELIIPVTVDLGTPDFLFVSPLPTTPLLVGESFQLTVIAQFSDGSQVDVTSSLMGVTYITSDPSVGIVSQDGLVTAQSEGEVEITIKVQSGEVKLQFNVDPGEVIGLPGG